MSDTKPNPTKKPTSRREFIRRSTAAVVAPAIAGSLNISRAAYAAGDDEIKVALIGCGGRGTGAASQALETTGKVKLIAMADAFGDRLEGSLKNLQNNPNYKDRIDVPNDRRFVGFDAYQKAIDAGPDLVILATPPGFRPIHFHAAVKAGKNVFMEKPVATDAPGIRLVLATAEEAKKKNLKVGVGLQRHHQLPYIETVKRLQDGVIGDLLAFRCYWNNAGVWVRPRQAGQTEMEYQMRNWYYFNWLCGDHICEQHIHNLDVCNWVRGGHPVRGNGQGGRQVRTGKDHGEIYDHHFVEFEYGDGSRMWSQCRHIPGCFSSVSEAVQGTNGWSQINRGLIQVNGKSEPIVSRGGKNPYQQEHDDLFHAVRNNIAHNEAEYGATSTMTSIFGRMLTYCGKELSWDDAINWGKSHMPAQFAWDAAPPTTPDSEGRYPIPVPGQYQPLLFDPNNQKQRQEIQKKFKPVPGGYEAIA